MKNKKAVNPNAKCLICNQEIPINKFIMNKTWNGYVCPNGCKLTELIFKKDIGQIQFR